MTESKKFERVLKAVASYRRLDILKALKRHNDLTVGDIAGEIHLSFKSTSRHLSVLLAADIVAREQIKLEVYYELSPDMPTLARGVISKL